MEKDRGICYTDKKLEDVRKINDFISYRRCRFIGSNFIFYWMKHYPEDRVICVDKLTYAGNIAALQPMMDRPNFRFCHLDICDRDGIERLFEDERPDIVVNLQLNHMWIVLLRVRRFF